MLVVLGTTIYLIPVAGPICSPPIGTHVSTLLIGGVTKSPGFCPHPQPRNQPVLFFVRNSAIINNRLTASCTTQYFICGPCNIRLCISIIWVYRYMIKQRILQILIHAQHTCQFPNEISQFNSFKNPNSLLFCVYFNSH